MLVKNYTAYSDPYGESINDHATEDVEWSASCTETKPAGFPIRPSLGAVLDATVHY